MEFEFGNKVEFKNNKFYDGVIGTIIGYKIRPAGNVYTVRVKIFASEQFSFIDIEENIYFLKKI